MAFALWRRSVPEITQHLCSGGAPELSDCLTHNLKECFGDRIAQIRADGNALQC